MSLKNIFKRKPNRFLELLIEQATLTERGLEELSNYLQQRNSKNAKKISQTEKEADEVRRVLIEELMKTFVTPFDREDIFSLSRTIDDVLDYAYSTVSEMEIMKVEPTNFMQQMASILRDAAYELLMAVDRLEDHPGVASDHAQRAKGLENRVEEMYRSALADLFGGAEDIQGVIKMMKSREVYRHLSNAADRVDEAANVIGDIIVKIT